MNLKIGKKIYGLLILTLLLPFLALGYAVAYEYLEKEKHCASMKTLTDRDKIKLAINRYEKSPIHIDGKLYPKVQHYADADEVLRHHSECCRIDDLSEYSKGIFPKGLVFIHLSYPVYYMDRDGQTRPIIIENQGFFVDKCGRVDLDW